jgi:hypothetical protein
MMHPRAGHCARGGRASWRCAPRPPAITTMPSPTRPAGHARPGASWALPRSIPTGSRGVPRPWAGAPAAVRATQTQPAAGLGRHEQGPLLPPAHPPPWVLLRRAAGGARGRTSLGPMALLACPGRHFFVGEVLEARAEPRRCSRRLVAPPSRDLCEGTDRSQARRASPPPREFRAATSTSASRAAAGS